MYGLVSQGKVKALQDVIATISVSSGRNQLCELIALPFSKSDFSLTTHFLSDTRTPIKTSHLDSIAYRLYILFLLPHTLKVEKKELLLLRVIS